MSQHIKEFLDEKYVDFAVYRTAQRLPHIMDCLGQTQRKILYTMEAFPENKKLKTAEVYSHVYSNTQYLHGDASVYTVVENLARSCSNNINILTEEGSFGYRTNTGAASPRYTSTRFSKAGRLIFRKEDQPIFVNQEFEGSSIEPKFLLPILPVGLLNGFLGIAVGFSSKFLPRDPNELIDELIKALTLKKRRKGDISKINIGTLTPHFPYCGGDIIHNKEHENPSAWLFTGKLRKTKTRNVVEIYEVPPAYTRESYLKKLKSMLEKGIIKDFDEGCQKDKFFFRVKLPPELWKLTEDKLVEKLNLVDSYVENLTFIDPRDPDQAIKKFNTAEEYLKSFMEIRQYFYTIRKDYQLGALQKEIDSLQERIKFIRAVNDGSIIITKRKKQDLEKELSTLGYLLQEDSYDYLLGMKLYALTDENVQKFTKYIKDKTYELQVLEKTTIEDMHIHELKELKKFIQPELQEKTV